MRSGPACKYIFIPGTAIRNYSYRNRKWETVEKSGGYWKRVRVSDSGRCFLAVPGGEESLKTFFRPKRQQN